MKAKEFCLIHCPVAEVLRFAEDDKAGRFASKAGSYFRRPTNASSVSTTVEGMIPEVKSYRIERIKGGMKFTCRQCTHSVSTLDFNAKGGNLRTQAATALNAHATSAHQSPMVISTYDRQQRSWR